MSGVATVFFPLIAGYAYHKQAATGRTGRRFSQMLSETPTGAGA